MKTNGLLLWCVITPCLFVISLICSAFFHLCPQIITGFHFRKRWLLNSSICLCGVLFCYDSLSLRWDGPILSLHFSLFLLFLSHFVWFVYSLSISHSPSVCIYPSVLVSFLIHLAFFFHHLLPSSSSVSFSLLSVFHLLVFTPLYIHFCHQFSLHPSYPTSSRSPTFPPTSPSPTPSDSQMKECKHVFHMRSHCAEPTEQNNHA